MMSVDKHFSFESRNNSFNMCRRESEVTSSGRVTGAVEINVRVKFLEVYKRTLNTTAD